MKAMTQTEVKDFLAKHGNTEAGRAMREQLGDDLDTTAPEQGRVQKECKTARRVVVVENTGRSSRLCYLLGFIGFFYCLFGSPIPGALFVLGAVYVSRR